MLIAILLLVSLSGKLYAFDEDDAGWQPKHFKPQDPWKEQQTELPAYPVEQDLLAVNINLAGQPFETFVDPASISLADDGVVRYTVVMISSSGVWNVSHEGLHCGENMTRRYAYGFDGQWQSLGDTPWMPITGRGINRYRRIFYDYFMCNPSKPVTSARQILENIRSPSSSLPD